MKDEFATYYSMRFFLWALNILVNELPFTFLLVLFCQ